MENEGDSMGIIHAIDGGNIYAAHVGLIPEVHQWVGLVLKLFQIDPPFKLVEEFIQIHLEAREKTREARGKDNSGAERQDFLEKLLDLEASGKNARLDTWTACTQNIGAGSDTTGISLSGVIYFLLKHPGALAKLRQELKDAEAAGTISSPITFKEAQGLPYLRAVIMETMRVHPAVGQPMTRVVPEGGATISGHYLPAGVRIRSQLVHPDLLCRRANVENLTGRGWRQPVGDPLQQGGLRSGCRGIPAREVVVRRDGAIEARPEFPCRKSPFFLCGVSPNGSHAISKRSSLTGLAPLKFGAGPRTCLGKNISLLELSKVIPEMIRHFDFELVSPDGEWETLNRWFIKSSYECLISERKQAADRS